MGPSFFRTSLLLPSRVCTRTPSSRDRFSSVLCATLPPSGSGGKLPFWSVSHFHGCLDALTCLRGADLPCRVTPGLEALGCASLGKSHSLSLAPSLPQGAQFLPGKDGRKTDIRARGGERTAEPGARLRRGATLGLSSWLEVPLFLAREMILHDDKTQRSRLIENCEVTGLQRDSQKAQSFHFSASGFLFIHLIRCKDQNSKCV